MPVRDRGRVRRGCSEGGQGRRGRDVGDSKAAAASTRRLTAGLLRGDRPISLTVWPRPRRRRNAGPRARWGPLPLAAWDPPAAATPPGHDVVLNGVRTQAPAVREGRAAVRTDEGQKSLPRGLVGPPSSGRPPCRTAWALSPSLSAKTAPQCEQTNVTGSCTISSPTPSPRPSLLGVLGRRAPGGHAAPGRTEALGVQYGLGLRRREGDGDRHVLACVIGVAHARVEP